MLFCNAGWLRITMTGFLSRGNIKNIAKKCLKFIQKILTKMGTNTKLLCKQQYKINFNVFGLFVNLNKLLHMIAPLTSCFLKQQIVLHHLKQLISQLVQHRRHRTIKLDILIQWQLASSLQTLSIAHNLAT
jgi:hypothetical protein